MAEEGEEKEKREKERGREKRKPRESLVVFYDQIPEVTASLLPLFFFFRQSLIHIQRRENRFCLFTWNGKVLKEHVGPEVLL